MSTVTTPRPPGLNTLIGNAPFPTVHVRAVLSSIIFRIIALFVYLPVELSVVKASPTTGAVDDQEVVAALRPNTVLVSIMLANNETGVIQPVGKIVSAVRRWQRDMGNKNQVFVHTDAAQVCTCMFR